MIQRLCVVIVLLALVIAITTDVKKTLIKACITEYWKTNIKKDKPAQTQKSTQDKPKTNPTPPGPDPEPTGNPEAVKAFVESIQKAGAGKA